ncbi:3-hydroxyacyl-CoA dehydrogenase family protein [Curvivirga sp.]|uniref:3-hydroxyacyl-CoA dehydrogenase family protein n=1 Tax=Curvivirga sp. TaxID=2856848 RepID=UPI003B5C5396
MSFTKVGIVGAGTMGSGIATNLAQQGVAVVLVDTAQEGVDRGVAAVNKFFSRAAEKGKISDADVEKAMSLVEGTTDLAKCGECDLVIEAIFEEFSVKEELFKKLNDIMPDDAVIATNTSCLRVSDLQKTVKNPSNFLGLHYFNPAAINPIVEVVKGEGTDDAVFARCLEFCKNTAKKPIACSDNFGFAINRFFVPYANEAVRMLDEGIASAKQLDRVAQECMEVAAGPMMVTNLVKSSVMYHAQTNLAPHGAFYTVAESLKDKGPKGEDYAIDDADEGKPENDGVVADRLRAAAFFPVLQALDENVATAGEIDMGAGLALRFGKAPCELMDSLGKEEVTRILTPIIDQYGHTMPSSINKVGSLRG